MKNNTKVTKLYKIRKGVSCWISTIWTFVGYMCVCIYIWGTYLHEYTIHCATGPNCRCIIAVIVYHCYYLCCCWGKFIFAIIVVRGDFDIIPYNFFLSTFWLTRPCLGNIRKPLHYVDKKTFDFKIQQCFLY